jgi:hypothetical protein
MALNSVLTLTSSLRLSSFQRTIKKSFERIVLSKLNKQNTRDKLFCLAHRSSFILRKEVIQPHLPIRLPCYDFTPIICPTLGGWLLAVTPPTSGVTNSRGVTGGVYKARERIHRGMLIRDY